MAAVRQNRITASGFFQFDERIGQARSLAKNAI
jgi:hypothetical protein